MPASEMLKMQPGRVEHSIPICGLLLGNNETLVNQGCSQSPVLGFAVVCLFFLVYTLILWLVIGGKFFNTARTLVFVETPHSTPSAFWADGSLLLTFP